MDCCWHRCPNAGGPAMRLSWVSRCRRWRGRRWSGGVWGPVQRWGRGVRVARPNPASSSRPGSGRDPRQCGDPSEEAGGRRIRRSGAGRRRARATGTGRADYGGFGSGCRAAGCRTRGTGPGVSGRRCRNDRTTGEIGDPATHRATAAERAMLSRLRAGCQLRWGFAPGGPMTACGCRVLYLTQRARGGSRSGLRPRRQLWNRRVTRAGGCRRVACPGEGAELISG
ncbi:MAG: hypothetical protein CM1200mP2_25830 [Planctomycetaceae bacterium]|nr:MAG: hypothetical protein CM1200mP2_25830 [Planctomycetaceae bacterium]